MPTQTTQRELQDALAALERARARQTRRSQEARSHVARRSPPSAGSGSSGLTPAQAGSFAGLDASLANELALAEAAGRQIDAAVRPGGAVRGRDAAGRRRRGAAGQPRPEHRRRRASSELAAALGQARDGVAAVQPQLDWPGGRRAVAARHRRRAAERAGRAGHAAVRAAAATGSAPRRRRIDTVRGQLRDADAGRSSRCARCDTLDRDSPGFFRSGYLIVAGLEGARPDAARGDRRASSTAPTAAGRRASWCMPDVPTNDPRQDQIVDDVRALDASLPARRPGSPRPSAGPRPS